jgi:uncharacterized protein YfdQ (DUF2303 family)
VTGFPTRDREVHRTDLIPSTPRTENDALIETAILSTEPAPLEPGKVYGWLTPNGQVQKIDLTGDEYRDHPARKTGTTTVRDVESFGQYWDKHADLDRAEVYADADHDVITAVLDAHASTVPGWGEHRLRYGLRRTNAWRTWTSNDRDLMGQTAFAELLEDNLPHIAEPDGAELLELAQTFTAQTEVSFRSGQMLADGSRELLYAENIEASGGRGGKKIVIPKQITIMIPPYEGAAPVVMTARFRYRINDGNLRLGYALDAADEALAAAFDDMVEQVETRIGRDVMRGHSA